MNNKIRTIIIIKMINLFGCNEFIESYQQFIIQDITPMKNIIRPHQV